MVEENPLTGDDIIASIFRALLGNGYAVPKAPMCRCSEIIAPVLRQRRNIMIKMGSEAEGPDIVGLTERDYAGSPILKSLVHNMSQRSLTGLGPGFHEEFSVVDDAGNVLKTNRVSKMIAEDPLIINDCSANLCRP